MQTICTSLQTDNHTNTSSLNFYRPDALPDAQPTVSTQSTEGTARILYYFTFTHCGAIVFYLPVLLWHKPHVHAVS